MKIFSKKYLNLIKEFSLTSFLLKDQRSALGFLWSFLNPLIMTTILFFLFKSRIGNNSNEYFLYILIGTTTWNFFAMATSAGLGSIINRSYVARNIAFPKEIMVCSSIGAFAIQYLFELLAVFVLLVVFGASFSAHVFMVPIFIIIEIFLILGISLILACLSAYAKDLAHVWSVVTRMGFFVVPIFYKISNISPRFRWIVEINPMTQIMTFLREALLYHRAPPLQSVAALFLFSLFVLFAGYKFFKLFEYKIVEIV